MSRILSSVLAVVGLAAIGFALAIAIVPDSVSSVVPIQVLTESTLLTEGSLRALGFAIAGTICIIWVAWTAGETRTKQLPDGTLSGTEIDFDTLRTEPPEGTNSGSIVGDQFDQTVLSAAVAAADGDTGDPARSEVRSLAVTVIAHTDGCTEGEAEETLADGSWTTDEVAAAYVADREASLSFRRRFFAWLRPSRTKFDRIERSLRAIERRERGEL